MPLMIMLFAIHLVFDVVIRYLAVSARGALGGMALGPQDLEIIDDGRIFSPYQIFGWEP